MRAVRLEIDGLPNRYLIAEIPDKCTPAELADALHMAADLIGLLHSLEQGEDE